MNYRPATTICAALALAVLAGCSTPIMKILPGVGHQARVADYYAINVVGNDAYSRGDYVGAIVEYEKMIAMRPNKIDGYMHRARSYYQMRMYSKSAADDTQAIAVLSTPEGLDELGFGDETPQ